MKFIEKLKLAKIENKLASLLKPIPALPDNVKKWLSKNLWWIVLIMVGLMIRGIISTIFNIFDVLDTINQVNKFNSPAWGSFYRAPAVYSGIWISKQSLSLLAFSIFSTIVYGMAILPLRDGKKKGWDMLFFMLLASGAWMILANIINFSFLFFIPAIIFGAVAFAAGAYLLIQLKSYFSKK